MTTVELIKPSLSGGSTSAALYDQGLTYNEAGMTYNQVGLVYEGVYGTQTAQRPISLIKNQEYTAGTLQAEYGMSVGLLLAITRP